jgi:hypothetical protein
LAETEAGQPTSDIHPRFLTPAALIIVLMETRCP